MKEPRADHEAKVRDAVNILRAKGLPHYRPDIAEYTGLSEAIVDQVFRWWEHQAIAKPHGRVTIPWTEMKGKLGGIAITPAERQKAGKQRGASLQTQLQRHELRTRTEYAREPISEKWAVAWARAARRIGRDEFLITREVIDEKHLEALLKSKVDVSEAVKVHRDLMAEIDKL